MTKALHILVSIFLTTQCLEKAVAATDVCSDYQIGESRIFTDDTLQGIFGGNVISYAVQKTAENQYQLTYTLDFSPSDQREFFQNKIGKCFDWFNESQQGSNDTQLRFALTGYHSNATPGVKSISIKIAPSNEPHRDSSRTYSARTGCETVIHEVLHLAGLVDEYPENLMMNYGGAPMYDCRSLSNSIMSYSTKFAQPQIQFEKYVVCGCAMGDGYHACIEKTSALAAKRDDMTTSCPAGSQVLENFDSVDSDNAMLAYQVVDSIMARTASKYKDIGIAFAFGSGASSRLAALKPAHIRALIFRGCKSKNPLYNQCTQNAYRTSKSHGGSGCADVPVACQSSDWIR